MIVSTRQFEQIVADALDALPDPMVQSLDNIAVIVEDEPTPEQLGGHGELLGLYEGSGSSSKGVFLPGYMSAPLATPDRVLLFRKPLCAISENEDELFQNVYDTLVHEFAHHFGIDDDRLEELGWA
jgi:predicted Zn-dependent protease with MMP-like domain